MDKLNATFIQFNLLISALNNFSNKIPMAFTFKVIV